MCGIAGARHDWLLERGLAPDAAMRAAIASLAWRGPDGQGLQRAGGWWLGCARLAITQPRSTQPVVRRGARFVGVLNGAITNARDIWAEVSPGIDARRPPPNDAWLPLLALEHRRPELLGTLRGHHAYAVVDTGRDELVIGQDRFAEKPLCCLVARRGGRWQLVAFASTPAALWRLGMPKACDTRRVAELLRFGWCEAKARRFGARLRLDHLPVRGAPMRADENRGSWVTPLLPAESPAPPAPAPSTLRRELLSAVGRCLDVEVPPALALSGGIDSSCIALAMRELGRRSPAYQFRANGRPDDERCAARAVASRTGLELHEVDGGPELLDALPHLTRCAGAVLGDPSILAAHAVARAAAADGARVLLGGEGGDELLLGYRRYRALARLPHAPWLRPFTPRWSMRAPARYLRAMVAANPIRALLAVTPPGFGDAVLAPRLAARRCWRDAEPMPTGAPPDLALAARTDDLAHYLPRDLLPKTDVATMAAGVEGRCPFLEGDLSPFGTRRDQLGKRELLGAFGRELPTEVLRLGKRGFAVPLDQWFRGDLPWIDLLLEQRTCQRPHLRPGGLAAVLDRHRRGAADLGHGLYLLLAIELHLRHIDATEESSAT
ncbi:MAG: asparagine synthetase B [Planctomycetes bacterium]|nr:asparagine synthetase B [Planctomycetota bacterium]